MVDGFLDDHRIEWSVARRSIVAIRCDHLDVVVAKPFQPCGRFQREGRHHFHADDSSGQIREHRGMVAGTRAGFEYDIVRGNPGEMGHEGHKIGLSDALLIAHGKWHVGVGKFGPYARHSNKFYSLGKSDDPFSITLDRALEIIHQKREQDKNKVIRKFDENPGLQILNGRWGPYIKLDKENFRIPKNSKAEELSYEECLRIIEKSREAKKKKT